MRRKLIYLLAGLMVISTVAACGSSTPSYKTMTCKQWLHLANSDDLTTGLNTAEAYLNSTSIDPTNGASDTAAFGDTISGVCGPTRLADTKIITLESQIVRVFLSVHPEDAP